MPFTAAVARLGGVTRRRTVLLVLLVAALALALAVGLPRGGGTSARTSPPDAGAPPPVASPPVASPPVASPQARAAAPDGPEARRLARHAVARRDDDLAALAELAEGDDAAALRAARDLAERAVDPALRLAALERVLELRPSEPLARRATTELHVEVGREAEAAGRTDRAALAYREALPDERAAEALRRLIDDPFDLANTFLQSRRYQDALDALGDLTAPSIEAPALRALDRHADALAAYRRWLEQEPADLEARFGVAWSHWYLGGLDRAEAAFAALPGGRALYGRALIANRRGDVDEAVRLLRASGDPRHLWLATALLEREERWLDAIEVYLELAAGGDGTYADDAAWRARTLAERVGADEARTRAEALVPDDSYFAIRAGADPPLPRRDDLADVRPEALATAGWLAEHADPEGARLVLVFALRAAESEAEQVVLGEALQALGEFREPQRAAATWLAAGSEQLRTWRLAYPEAWPHQVGREAKEAGVEPELIWAVMRRESAFYPEAISRSGAQGLMQVMPSTWDWLAELQDEPPADPFDVAANIRYGAFYLGWLQDHFRGELHLAVASYNRGQGYIGRLFDSDEVRRDMDELVRAIDALETREYLQAVWRSYRVYQGLDRLEAEGLPAEPAASASSPGAAGP
jgi:soluble lytic murein transglycosylase